MYITMSGAIDLQPCMALPSHQYKLKLETQRIKNKEKPSNSADSVKKMLIARSHISKCEKCIIGLEAGDGGHCRGRSAEDGGEGGREGRQALGNRGRQVRI